MEVRQSSYAVLGLPPAQIFFATELVPPQAPCDAGTYWGDYNDLTQLIKPQDLALRRASLRHLLEMASTANAIFVTSGRPTCTSDQGSSNDEASGDRHGTPRLAFELWWDRGGGRGRWRNEYQQYNDRGVIDTGDGCHLVQHRRRRSMRRGGSGRIQLLRKNRLSRFLPSTIRMHLWGRHWRLPQTPRVLSAIWRLLRRGLMQMIRAHQTSIVRWLGLFLAASLPSIWLGACSGHATIRAREDAGAGGAGAGVGAGDTTAGTGGDGSAGADSGAGGELIPLDAFDPVYVYDGPAYDGDMSCAPIQTGTYEAVSCCDGVPCNGLCELHDNVWTCTCFGIELGCGPFGLKCCSLNFGCTSGCF